MKKKYKRAGTTSERQDYRKGGQVSKDGPRQEFISGGYAIGDGDIGLAAFDIANFPRINIPPAPVFTPTPVQTNTFIQEQSTIGTTGGTLMSNGTLTPEEIKRKRQDLEAQAGGRGVQATPMQVQTLAGQVAQGEIEPGTGDLGGVQTVTGTTGQTQAPEQVTTAAPCLLYTSPSPRDQRGSSLPAYC